MTKIYKVRSSLEKCAETIIMKDHLCQVKVFGGYPIGNGQLVKDFKGAGCSVIRFEILVKLLWKETWRLL